MSFFERNTEAEGARKASRPATHDPYEAMCHSVMLSQVAALLQSIDVPRVTEIMARVAIAEPNHPEARRVKLLLSFAHLYQEFMSEKANKQEVASE